MTVLSHQITTTQDSVLNPIISTPAEVEATSSQTTEYFVYFLFGALEILLAFRLILKLMGASTTSIFVRSIYTISSLFTFPFDGIFHREFTQGLETTSVLEPSTIVALIVYAVVVWGIVKLIRISSGTKQEV